MIFLVYFLDDSVLLFSLFIKCNRKYKVGGYLLFFREIFFIIIYLVWGLYEILWEDNG